MPISVSIVAEEIERIRFFQPKDVVNKSRPDDAFLHPAFEWDDSVAAEKYRIDQARYIMRTRSQ